MKTERDTEKAISGILAGHQPITGAPGEDQARQAHATMNTRSRQSPSKASLPAAGNSKGYAGAQDSTSSVNGRFHLSPEQILTLPWDRLPFLLTLSEAALRARQSTWTIRQAIHSGDLPGIQRGRRLLVNRAELHRWLDQGRTSPRSGS